MNHSLTLFFVGLSCLLECVGKHRGNKARTIQESDQYPLQSMHKRAVTDLAPPQLFHYFLSSCTRLHIISFLNILRHRSAHKERLSCQHIHLMIDFPWQSPRKHIIEVLSRCVMGTSSERNQHWRRTNIYNTWTSRPRQHPRSEKAGQHCHRKNIDLHLSAQFRERVL